MLEGAVRTVDALLADVRAKLVAADGSPAK